MTPEQLRAIFADLGVWKRGDERAPHKPLLLLMALGRASRGEDRLIPFTEVERDLTPLLKDFGPPRRSHHPEFPFYYLQSEGIWEVTNLEDARSRQGKPTPTRRELERVGASGGLKPDAWDMLRSDSGLVEELARLLLELHFPESMHEDILVSVGLRFRPVRGEQERDPEFRTTVLNAYEHRCALCACEIKLDGRDVGLEAAHIQWHQARGPSTVQNGLALCILHHKLFDRGAFSLTPGLEVEISQHVHGGTGFEEWLLRFHGREIRRPFSPRQAPESKYVLWHRREVFRTPGRDLQVDRVADEPT